MPINCNVCGLQLSRRDALNRHLLRVHNVQPAATEPRPAAVPHPTEEPLGITCSACGQSFTLKKNLNRHMAGRYSRQQEGGPVFHQCEECDRRFRRREQLERHVETTHNNTRFPCDQCGATFGRRGDLLRHIKATHDTNGITCDYCAKSFKRQDAKDLHERFHCPTVRDLLYGVRSALPQPGPSSDPQPGPSSAPQPSPQPSTGPNSPTTNTRPNSPTATTPAFKLVEVGFRSRLQTYQLEQPLSSLVTVEEGLALLFTDLLELLQNVLTEHNCVKVNMFMECEFVNVQGSRCIRAFKTKNVQLTAATDLEEVISTAFTKLIEEKQQCELVGSGWTYLRIRGMEVRVNEYTPLGEEGGSHIPLPPSFMHSRHSVTNVLNDDDNYCFMYAVLNKCVQNDPKRPTSYTDDIIARYDWTGFRFPVALKDIRIFERNNAISINVYGIDHSAKRSDNPDTIFPLKICRRELQDHRDLLFVTTEDGNSHYMYISDLSSLVRPQLTSHDGRIHLCKRCFAYFDNRPNKLGLTGAERLEEHMRYCYANAPLRLDMPTEKSIKFKHPEFSRRERFAIYADFECALRPTVEVPDVTSPRDGNTTCIHVPYAFAYKIVDSLGIEEFDTRIHFGADVSKTFMEMLKADVTRIWDILYGVRNLRPNLTREEWNTYNAATNCYLCNKPFVDNDDWKVRDHNHAPPYEYRGPAHRSCNLRYREQSVIGCYFHILSNYDGHFIVRELAVDQGDVEVLAHTEERYISFSKKFDIGRTDKKGRPLNMKVRFLDSYRFLSSSLGSLAAALTTDQLTTTRHHFTDDRLFNLVRRKGVFPYNFVTSHDVLTTTRALPPKEDFFNDMTLEHVSDEDYEHACDVWQAFNCQDLKDYAEVYLRCDVALLTDVFEQFRTTSLTEYGLDPAHYFTLPSYAWDVMLKTCDVELDTMQDFDMYLFIEQGIRGGISQAISRHAKANHDRCRPEDRCPDEPTRHLLYVDANNLYGWAMSQCLPTGDFQWLSREEIDNLDFATMDAESERGYILEVDLHYPARLHDLHRDLPYCCETRRPPTGKTTKLLTTLDDKTHYVCHYRVLKQALDNGLELAAVHRAISFRQSRWLERYILKNTELRKHAKTKFEQDYFKLMNNAVFGKTIENVRKRLNVQLVCTPEKFSKYVAKSNFVDRTYFNDDVALIHLSKVNIVLNKPTFVGMSVLELSKWLMYDFLEKMKRRYGDRLEVIYMDTDSFIFSIKTEDVYQYMLQHLDDFDTSAYPKNHPCYSPINAKVIGKFKDEANGRSLLEYLGLRSKLYFMDIADDDDDAVIAAAAPPTHIKTVKRAKGVARGVVKNVLTTDDYRDCLFNGVLKHTTNTRFQSHLHRVFTVQVDKLSLSPNDDKRYILPDGVNTLPWGHIDIPLSPTPTVMDVDEEAAAV